MTDPFAKPLMSPVENPLIKSTVKPLSSPLYNPDNVLYTPPVTSSGIAATGDVNAAVTAVGDATKNKILDHEAQRADRQLAVDEKNAANQKVSNYMTGGQLLLGLGSFLETRKTAKMQREAMKFDLATAKEHAENRRALNASYKAGLAASATK